ncbi:hypothetical protein [Caballeronia choica]|nr:hypothetical protein [Caballeronia choica]
MKKAVLVIVVAATTLFSVAPVFAYEHHHPVCHEVKVHHHWEKRCH